MAKRTDRVDAASVSAGLEAMRGQAMDVGGRTDVLANRVLAKLREAMVGQMPGASYKETFPQLTLGSLNKMVEAFMDPERSPSPEAYAARRAFAENQLANFQKLVDEAASGNSTAFDALEKLANENKAFKPFAAAVPPGLAARPIGPARTSQAQKMLIGAMKDRAVANPSAQVVPMPKEVRINNGGWDGSTSMVKATNWRQPDPRNPLAKGTYWGEMQGGPPPDITAIADDVRDQRLLTGPTEASMQAELLDDMRAAGVLPRPGPQMPAGGGGLPNSLIDALEAGEVSDPTALATIPKSPRVRGRGPGPSLGTFEAGGPTQLLLPEQAEGFNSVLRAQGQAQHAAQQLGMLEGLAEGPTLAAAATKGAAGKIAGGLSKIGKFAANPWVGAVAGIGVPLVAGQIASFLGVDPESREEFRRPVPSVGQMQIMQRYQDLQRRKALQALAEDPALAQQLQKAAQTQAMLKSGRAMGDFAVGREETPFQDPAGVLELLGS